MRKGQRSQTRQRLQEIDTEIVRTAMRLHSLLQDRLVIDRTGTEQLITGIVTTLQVVPLGSEGEEA